MNLPGATPHPCDECPWVRSSAPGWLGPHSAQEWTALAHSDEPIACHKTIKDVDDDGLADWRHPSLRQCRGAAIFRSNIMKSPRNRDVATGPRDTDTVFKWDDEFIAHHLRKEARRGA